jgi:amino acid transporter
MPPIPPRRSGSDSATQHSSARIRWGDVSGNLKLVPYEIHYDVGIWLFYGYNMQSSKIVANWTLQGLWAALLVLPRAYNPATQTWGNLYSNLLEYVISAALIFYVLTVAGVFRLRITRPEVPRPYRTFGYPWVPGFYILLASIILVILFVYRPSTTWPGLLIVLLGIPIYLMIRKGGRAQILKSSASIDANWQSTE